METRFAPFSTGYHEMEGGRFDTTLKARESEYMA